MECTVSSFNTMSIADQHAALAEQVDQVSRVLRLPGANAAQVIEQARNLLQFATAHFAHEERLMEHENHAERVSHKRDHDYLRTSLISFIEAADHGSVPVVPDFGINLHSWLEHHVRKFDAPHMEAASRSG